MGYVIGSFNIRDFDITKDFDKLADIILSEKMDVIGIQEVNSKQAVNRLVEILNRRSIKLLFEWKGSFPDYPRSRDPSGESYAFIWNNKRLSLVDVGDKENPTLVERFHIKGIPGQTELLRNPYFARFTGAKHIGGSNFEIRLINTHIRFSKGTRDLSCADSEMKMRINEFELLAKEILPYCGDIRTGNNMPAYTFLLGDYNLCLENGHRGDYRISEITPGNKKTWNRFFKTVQDKPTSLKKPQDELLIVDDEDAETEINKEDGNYYSQNYDHFTYDYSLESKMSIKSDRVEAVEIAYSGDMNEICKLKKYRSHISDHVPIKITVDFSRRAR